MVCFRRCLTGWHPVWERANSRRERLIFRLSIASSKKPESQLKSPLVRLQYTGYVDFEGRISDAGVVAEPLRDTWVIGPVLGPVLNLALSRLSGCLKFNVTGTMNDPEMELKHIPKVLLVPVQLPFKLIDELVLDGESIPNTEKDRLTKAGP